MYLAVTKGLNTYWLKTFQLFIFNKFVTNVRGVYTFWRHCIFIMLDNNKLPWPDLSRSRLFLSTPGCWVTARPDAALGQGGYVLQMAFFSSSLLSSPLLSILSFPLPSLAVLLSVNFSFSLCAFHLVFDSPVLLYQQLAVTKWIKHPFYLSSYHRLP